MFKNKIIAIQFIAVMVGILLLAIKFFAYAKTNSNTILSDALESIINVVAGGIGLYSLYISSLPKDENHPYGHGKIEFISAGIEGTMITLAGLLIIGKSVYNLFYPEAIQEISLGILIAGFAGVVNYILGAVSVHYGKKENSIALTASGKHLKSDAYSTVGLVVGLAIIHWTGIVYLDSAIALFFGALICWTGFPIIKESIAGIMDEVDPELINKVVDILDQDRSKNWIDVHNLRIIKYGSQLHLDCHLTLPWYYNVQEAHNEVDNLEDLLRKQVDPNMELFVHVDACPVSSCNFCQNKDCPFRQADFAGTVAWTPELVMTNKKHGLPEENTASV